MRSPGERSSLESEVNGKSAGRHEHAFAAGTGLQHRLDLTLDLFAHEPSSLEIRREAGGDRVVSAAGDVAHPSFHRCI